MSTTFEVWRERYGRDEDSVTIEAYNIQGAAQKRAEEDHAKRAGWEWTWPVTYHVRAPEGEVYKVEVQRHVVPEFEAGRPEFVRTDRG